MLSFSRDNAAELIETQLAIYEGNVTSGVPKDVAAMLFHANIKEYVRRYTKGAEPSQFLAEGLDIPGAEIRLGPLHSVPPVP